MSTEEKSKELVLYSEAIVLSPELTVKELEAIRDIMAGASEYEVPGVDASVVTEDVLNRMLFAESEEELLAEVTTWSSKDSIGLTFRIFPNGRLWPSKIVNKETGKKGAFLSVQAMDKEGEMGVFNSSAPRIVGKLVWYARHDQLPAFFTIVKRGESANGFDVLDIDKVA